MRERILSSSADQNRTVYVNRVCSKVLAAKANLLGENDHLPALQIKIDHFTSREPFCEETRNAVSICKGHNTLGESEHLQLCGPKENNLLRESMQ